MFLYALAIFLGAFLLFQVQPLLGKFILPWFGGGPGVWTACLLFFQTLLLVGYAYAHLLNTRCRPRTQALVHALVLLAALAFLPIIPSETWKPHGGDNPTLGILVLLAATVGVPYLALAATGPLFQSWLGRTHPGTAPYRLYALSNTGSLLALLSYPFVFEPLLSRQTQAIAWSLTLTVFAALGLACAWRVSRVSDAPRQPAAVTPPVTESTASAAPTWSERAWWLVLPAIASMLLMATTNKLCQEVAVVPFLWVLPLALYLVSFILCFDHARWYRRGLFVALLVLGVGTVASLLYAGHTAGLRQQVVGYATTLFAACMVCHGEVYRLRPAPCFLTSYYLHLAAGGALGGLLVAVVAPLVFTQYVELQIGLAVLLHAVALLAFRHRDPVFAWGAGAGLLAIAVVVPACRVTGVTDLAEFFPLWWEQWTLFITNYGWFALFAVAAVLAACLARGGFAKTWRPRMGLLVLVVYLAAGVVFIVQAVDDSRLAVDASRNFYGTLKVFLYNDDEASGRYYLLRHGATTHGIQFARLPQAMWPTTYYGETSGIGYAIRQHQKNGPVRIGLVGLGTGTLTAYGRPGDYLRIYEINPAVERLARSRFTYLAHTPANVDVVLGDARLSLEAELARGDTQRFDVLALDAFTSDAIPAHLLTREAFTLYLRHLAPDGVIAVHISNRYLELRPIVERLANEFGYLAATVDGFSDDKEWWVYRTRWVLVTRDAALLQQPEVAFATEASSNDTAPGPLWTDDHTSLVEVLR